MSLLRNPGFERGVATPWDRLNEAQAVNYAIGNVPGVAKSGQYYLRFTSAVVGGSMAQDISVSMPSVSGLAWVRAEGPNPVNGTFAIWQLDTNENTSVNFTVGQSWELVTAMKDITGGANRPVRVEFYIGSTVNEYMLVDSVAAF